MSKRSKRESKREKRRLRKASRETRRGLHGRVKHVMSNFRLSLTFRIALHYSWQLLKTTLPVMLVMTLVLCGFMVTDINDTVNRLRFAGAEENGHFSPAVIRHSEVTKAELLSTPFSGEPLPLLDFTLADWEGFSLTVTAQHDSGMTVIICFTLWKAFYAWVTVMAALLFRRTRNRARAASPAANRARAARWAARFLRRWRQFMAKIPFWRQNPTKL